MGTRKGAVSDIAQGALLGLYESYLSALDAVTSQLLDSTDDDSFTDIVRQLALATRSDACQIYLYHRDPSLLCNAQLLCGWCATPALDKAFDHLKAFSLLEVPEMNDALQVGMIFVRNGEDLPPSIHLLLKTHHLAGLVAVPLLVSGELEGFLLFSGKRERQAWHSVELRVLSAVANDLAMALTQRKAQRASIANQRRLEALVGVSDDMVFEFDARNVIVNTWSSHPAIPSHELTGKTLQEALPAEMASSCLRTASKLFKNGNSETVRFSVPLLAGYTYFIARLYVVPAADGGSHNIVAQVRDVTHLMQEEAAQKTLLETLSLLEEAIIDLSPAGALLKTTLPWAKFRAIEADAIEADYGYALTHFVPQEDRDKLQAAIDMLADGDLTTQSVRFRMPRPGNEGTWIEAKLLAHRSPEGEIIGVRGVLRDITTAYQHERHITQLALYDALTQLPNRILLDDHLHQALIRARRNNLKVALGFIDLDHFKQINDTFGHSAGDSVLVNLGRQLRSVLRDIDTLARWGGDEFVALIPDLPNLVPLRNIAERLREIARAGVFIDGLETKSTISIGFAVFPDDAEDEESLMSAADSTMFYAKSIGRNNVQFYSDVVHLRAASREQVALQARLSNAIEHDKLEVYFQPIINAQTGQVTEVEALTRWHDGQTGWINPQVFIPIAERLGLIRELGEQVMKQAFGVLQQWRRLGLHQRMAINVSRAQLFSPEFSSRLQTLLISHGLKPQDIEIEITESVALTDYSQQMVHLKALSQAGFKIAIDDFGTGYSSLSQLHEMPVDILKIDNSFTSRLHTEEGRRIVLAIVQMAQALCLEIVVEGVEKSTTASFLQGLGVKKLQGHYFSPPISASECYTLLVNGVSVSS
ncbi:diguanylate cyclase (GGDEF)-like protein [Chitinivorax tropicus]|uniref:Diguanylate cyclase (GGDEF)-like protein n=1 Tax=Chitinivorax tropicus TaxID=714531 RepID=A0A840MKH2_9PROT|nr:EAL domain-containing protein [Chitinivorax tropicus]MBB5017347.1 diguanylate cyclase (GGDEF)-like protein [Chitinivorax tropicus]